MGRVFHALGLIEQWGSGIQRMPQACLQAGLPAPVLEELGSGFRVTFQRQGHAAPKLEAMDQEILDFIARSGQASVSKIAEHIRRTPRATRTRANRLADLGLLAAMGANARDPQRTFRLASKKS